MAHKHSRHQHKRLFPELGQGEWLRARAWIFGERVITDRRIALQLEGEIQRQIRLAQSEGRAVDLLAILAGLPWDRVRWYPSPEGPAKA